MGDARIMDLVRDSLCVQYDGDLYTERRKDLGIEYYEQDLKPHQYNNAEGAKGIYPMLSLTEESPIECRATENFRLLHSAPHTCGRKRILFMDRHLNISLLPHLTSRMDKKSLKTQLSFQRKINDTKEKHSKAEEDNVRLNNNQRIFPRAASTTPRSIYITEGRAKFHLTSDHLDACNNTVVSDRLRDGWQRRRKEVRQSAQMTETQSDVTISSEEDNSNNKKKGIALHRFRIAAVSVQILVRWLNAIIVISDHKTTRTATEEQWYTLYTSQEARKLAFNKSLYARERAFARVPTWAIRIFESDPEVRSESDCRRIHALLRGLKSFDKFTEKIQLYMCRAFRYQSVEPGRVILRRGHVGFNFYFIYSGSVFVNIADINIEGKRFEKTETVLIRGDSFGELALLQDIRRTATITCRERCEVLVVDKETFAKVCPRIFDRELEEKEKFLSRLPLFSPKYWSRDMLKLVCTEAQIQEYKTNKVVATDGDNEDWMYICMEGKCEVIRRVALDDANIKRQAPKRPSTPELPDEILDIIKNVNKSKDAPDSCILEGHCEIGSAEYALGKERLLDSMSLEYRKDGRRRKIMKSPEKEVIQRKDKMILKGPISLTSLMTMDKENNEGKEFMYLNIATVKPEQIFDLYSILYPGNWLSNSVDILVSLGARLLRIKKKVYYDVISSDALMHAKLIAKKHRYPSDKQLLSSYKEKYNWDIYKKELIKSILQPHARIAKLSNSQKHTVIDNQLRSAKLLKVLENNTFRDQSRKNSDIKELEKLREENDAGSQPAEAVILQALSTPKTSTIIHNFVIGRRSLLTDGKHS